MHNAIEKLSRINRSLILLTKMENQEFAVRDSLNICTVTREVLENFADRITLREITVRSNIDKGVALRIHPALAEMLVNNLLSNAVRHNVDGGAINIHLTPESLVVSNTGLPLAVPADDLFLRFKKSDQCADSIGLGLAIVKQVCDVNGFKVIYQNQGDIHTVTVLFSAKSVAASRAPVGRTAEPAI
jgi:two-component system sensor histidine kinase QseC